MKSLSIPFLCLSFILLAASQDMFRTWTADWQNEIYTGCQPYSIQLTNNTVNDGQYEMEYYFTSNTIFEYCYSAYHIVGNFLDYYYSTNSSYVWTDSYGASFTYDPTTETITYPFVGPNGPPLLFTLNNTVSEEVTLGTLGGSWVSPVPMSGSQTTCCVPDSIFITLRNPQSGQVGQFNAYYNFSKTECEQDTIYNFQIVKPNPVQLNWKGIDTKDSSSPQHQIYFSPMTTTSSLILTLNSSGATCSYAYHRLSTSQMLSGTWYQDWQSTPDGLSPVNYSVTPNYQYNYMTSVINLANNATIESYLVQTPQGQYFDSSLGLNGTTFTYDSATSTLLSVSSAPFTEDNLLLSPSGSIFSPASFINFWGSAEASDGLIPSLCCAPTYINITNTTNQNNTLGVTYIFSNESNSGSVCGFLASNIYNNQIQSVLYVETPNISQLTWTDQYLGNQISFSGPNDYSTLFVSDFNGKCSFTMLQTVPPTPMISNLISHKIVLFIIGAFMLINLI